MVRLIVLKGSLMTKETIRYSNNASCLVEVVESSTPLFPEKCIFLTFFENTSNAK